MDEDDPIPTPDPPKRGALPDPPEWEYERPPSQVKIENQRRGDAAAYRGMGIAMGIGFALVVPVVLFGGLGMLADRWAGKGTTWMMVGVLLGTVAGFAMLIRLVNKLNEK